MTTLCRIVSPRAVPGVDLPTQPEAWARLIETARTAQLLPLLAWRSKKGAAVPDSVRRELDQALHANTAQNLGRVNEMLRIFETLQSRSVPVLALKGPALARLCYRNLGARVFQDIDLLAPRDYAQQAIQLMLDRGYRHWLPQWSDSELEGLFSRPDYLRFLWRDHAMMVRRDPSMVIEIHWEASPRYFSFPLPFQSLWENRQTVTLSGQSLPTLSDQDTLLLLAAHGAKHSWQELKLVCDFSWAIHSLPDESWEGLRERAAHLGGLRMIRVGGHLAQRLFDTRSLTELVGDDPTSRRIAGQVQDRLTRALAADQAAPDHHQTKIQIRERFSDRLRMVRRFLFTPSTRDWRWVALPPLLFPLYRILRPLRLAWRRLTNPSGSSLQSD